MVASSVIRINTNLLGRFYTYAMYNVQDISETESFRDYYHWKRYWRPTNLSLYNIWIVRMLLSEEAVR